MGLWALASCCWGPVGVRGGGSRGPRHGKGWHSPCPDEEVARTQKPLRFLICHLTYTSITPNSLSLRTCSPVRTQRGGGCWRLPTGKCVLAPYGGRTNDWKTNPLTSPVAAWHRPLPSGSEGTVMLPGGRGVPGMGGRTARKLCSPRRRHAAVNEKPLALAGRESRTDLTPGFHEPTLPPAVRRRWQSGSGGREGGDRFGWPGGGGKGETVLDGRGAWRWKQAGSGMRHPARCPGPGDSPQGRRGVVPLLWRVPERGGPGEPGGGGLGGRAAPPPSPLAAPPAGRWPSVGPMPICLSGRNPGRQVQPSALLSHAM